MKAEGAPLELADPRLIALVRESFPRAELPGKRDLAVVESQLGRRPQGECYISRRCPFGMPAVVLTLPFEGGGAPVPPLLWLCCPVLSSRAGTLESASGGERVREWLDESGEASSGFARDEDAFCEAQARIARAAGGEVLAGRLGERGAAGGEKGAVKCFHAHLAYRLSVRCDNSEAARPGVIGSWCEMELETEGGTWCERPPAACVP